MNFRRTPDDSTLARGMARAEAHYAAGAWADAEAMCRQLLELDATHFDALHLLAVIAAQTGRVPEAASLLERATHARPEHTPAQINRAHLLRALGRWPDALAGYERALRLDPRCVEALYHRAEALEMLGHSSDALAGYEQALAARPDYVEAHLGRGNVLQALGRSDEALSSYERALALQPAMVEALYNAGNVERLRGCALAALGWYERALAAAPDFVAAHNNRGNVLQDLGRLEESLACYERAVALTPGLAEAHLNRSSVLRRLGRLEEALQGLEQIGAEDPAHVEALVAQGEILMERKRFDDAYRRLGRALELAPEHPWLRGGWLYAKLHCCDWQDLVSQRAALVGGIDASRRVSPPFPMLLFVDAPRVHRQAAELWAQDVIARAAEAVDSELESRSGASVPRQADGRIRLGYFSSDFQNHPTAHLAAGLFEAHDRTRFHCTAFSFGPDSEDEMRRRLRAAFDEFVDAGRLTDLAVARLAEERGIDVAIDLNGFTRHERAGIFVRRAAPLQVSYLGYPGTLALPTMDYLIADRVVITTENRAEYLEKIAFLPHSYQVNDGRRAIAPERFERADLGLPATGFVFCCFNHASKLTPEVFASWMRILKAVEGSVLWLLEDLESSAAHLRQTAEAHGVRGERLIFARRLPQARHLARQRAADLVLDTLPYNAHTTASDALWAGVPVLTCKGRAFAGRVAASLLTALELPELITTSQADYEACAIELAKDPARLEGIRAKLARHRETHPLFDTTRFARYLERAFTRMFERRRAGLPPEDFDVEP